MDGGMEVKMAGGMSPLWNEDGVCGLTTTYPLCVYGFFAQSSLPCSLCWLLAVMKMEVTMAWRWLME